MEIRKVLRFNKILGVTIPQKYSRVLGLEPQDHIEIYLADKETLVLKKHDRTKRKGINKYTANLPETTN